MLAPYKAVADRAWVTFRRPLAVFVQKRLVPARVIFHGDGCAVASVVGLPPQPAIAHDITVPVPPIAPEFVQ